MLIVRGHASHSERGQTLPFWVMGVLVSLALAFFVANYAGTIKNQIHAQNAADSAASAALGRDAAALNSTQTLLAAVDIQQLKVTDAEAGLPYVLGTNPCGPAALLDSTCINALEGAAKDVAKANKSLADFQATISNFERGLTGSSTTVSTPQVTGLLSPASAQTTIASFFAPNGTGGCAVAVLTDCNYRYTTNLTLNSAGFPVVDEYACKAVINNAWSFLHLPMQKYYAIGHTTSTLAPFNAAYNSGTLGQGLQTTSSLYPDAGGTAASLTGDISALNINSNFYGAVAAPPPTTTPYTAAQVCPPLS